MTQPCERTLPRLIYFCFDLKGSRNKVHDKIENAFVLVWFGFERHGISSHDGSAGCNCTRIVCGSYNFKTDKSRQ